MTDDRSSSRGGGGRERRGYFRPRDCRFCADSSIMIDYKDVDLLKSFVSREGKIMARRATGTCARHQRELAVAIKQARHIALLPFASEVLR